MSRRSLSLVTALALWAGLFVITALPAAAEAPTSVASLLPNASHPETDQMSDASDGVTTIPGARFTALADDHATQVTWFQCGVGGASETDQPAGCVQLGSSDNGLQTEGGGDEGYEMNTEFTSAQQGNWDVVVQACEGSPGADGADVGTLADNCVQDVESGIRFDDGETGGREFVTGEAPATCEQLACTSPPSYVSGNAVGEVTFEANGGVAAYTSLDAGDMSACFDLGVTSATETFTCDVFSTGALYPYETTDTFKRGAAFIDYPVGQTWALLVYASSVEFGCPGAEVVAGDEEMEPEEAASACVVAITYGRSTSADPAVAIATFGTEGHTCHDTIPLDEDGVPAENDRVRSMQDEYEVLEAPDTRTVEACVQKPAKDAYRSDVQMTWESMGPGELTSCEGTLSDTNSDGLDDRCVIPTGGADEIYSAAIGNTDESATGDQMLTVCADPEGDGCANATVYDTLMAVWLGDIPVTQCNDGVDNDEDGTVDLGDAGCTDVLDDTENSDVPSVEDADTSLTLKFSKGAFKGKLTSDNDACVGGAKVTIKKGTTKLGTATTSGTGAYKFKPNKKPKAGKYKASVKARSVEEATVNCGASSATTKIS